MTRKVFGERESRPVEEADFTWHAIEMVSVTSRNGAHVVLVDYGRVFIQEFVQIGVQLRLQAITET